MMPKQTILHNIPRRLDACRWWRSEAPPWTHMRLLKDIIKVFCGYKFGVSRPLFFQGPWSPMQMFLDVCWNLK